MDHVRFAPLQNDPLPGALTVALATRAYATFWENEVQPDIRAAQPSRPDRWWHWPMFLRLFPRTELLNGRRCYGHTLVAADTTGEARPVAMSLLVETVTFLPASGPSTFLWFMSGIPSTTLRRLGLPLFHSLGQILVDAALVVSLNQGNDGRACLHGDPQGGKELLARFEHDYGLARLPANLQLRSVRKNDGRYFYTDETLARLLLAQLAPWR